MKIYLDTENKFIQVLGGRVKDFVKEIKEIKDWEEYTFEEDFSYPLTWSIN